mgnify:CR=1 FL=1
MQRASGERSRAYGSRHVVPIGGAEFISPRRARVSSPPQGMSSADAYQKAIPDLKLSGSPPSYLQGSAFPSSEFGAPRRRGEPSGSQGSSISSNASSVSSPTSPSIGGSTSSWKIQQDSYSEALYRHTSAMWEADRRSLERASLDPNAVTSPMQHSSRLSMQLNPPGRPSSVEITGHRRGKSLRVSKQQGISSADLQKDTSRSKSLRRFL